MNYKRVSKIVSAVFIFIITGFYPIQVAYCQTGYPLTPVSGADGVFETVIIDGATVYRSASSAGSYALYMYFQCNVEIHSATVYVEINYKDIGYGKMGIHYNSTTTNYQDVAIKYGNYVQNTNGERTAVFKLKNADFRNAQNLGTDLRLTSSGSLQKHIISATVYLEPPQSFLKYDEDWISPYEGPEYLGDNLVDAGTLTGKVICGYQGWFRAPGDPAGGGWNHYVDGSFNDLTVEMWPDMNEYTVDEKYAVPGWTHTDGKQAFLFSSANKKTVLRHFQWMESYGIDGVAVQRFVVGLKKNHPVESFRIPGYAREAANRTGRTYFIMYDMSSYTPNQLADFISDDWRYLVDVMNITSDDRYLHHEGKPIVGIFGFFSERFSSTIADQVLDIFQQGGQYGAFVVGSGEWWWRTDNASGWPNVFKRMDAWIPWNVGNIDGNYATTNFWSADKSEMESSGVLYMPLVYPGSSWDNLMNQSPGTTNISRLQGDFLWRQFRVAKNIDAQTVYVAMFDEIDEATSIFKVTNNIPVNHYFLTLEGLPSDFYLLMTGLGTSIINGSVGLPQTMPNFSSQSQPPIPDILAPVYDDTVANPVSISWTGVNHLTEISGYELEIDGNVISETTTETDINLNLGNHTIRARAINGLQNKSGYSEATVFTVAASVGVQQIESNSPAEFSLLSNYPNPFNPTTTIQYGIPDIRDVSIMIYDLMGRRVTTLFHNEQQAGWYEITWNGLLNNGSLAPAGLYLYKIMAGEEIKTSKISLIK